LEAKSNLSFNPQIFENFLFCFTFSQFLFVRKFVPLINQIKETFEDCFPICVNRDRVKSEIFSTHHLKQKGLVHSFSRVALISDSDRFGAKLGVLTFLVSPIQ
jgi:hypothetical protein